MVEVGGPHDIQGPTAGLQDSQKPVPLRPVHFPCVYAGQVTKHCYDLSTTHCLEDRANDLIHRERQIPFKAGPGQAGRENLQDQ